MPKKSKHPQTIFDVPSGRGRSSGPPEPNKLTPSERRKLSKAESVDPRGFSDLLEQIRHRHETFNAIEVEVEIPELAEQEVIQRVLHLANRYATFEHKVAAFLNCASMKSVSHGYPITREMDWAQREEDRYAIVHWWDKITDIRAEFLKAVLAAFNNPVAARRRYGKKIREALEQIVIVPRHVWDGRSGRTELRYFSLNESAACGYVLMLLLDQERPYGTLLRLCGLDSCGRPFLAVHAPGGSPPTAYCSEDCRVIAKRNANARRQEALRERNKKAKKRKKP